MEGRGEGLEDAQDWHAGEAGVADGARGGQGQAVRRCLIALGLGWEVWQCTGRGGQI